MNETPDLIYRLATREEWFIARETGVVPPRDIDHNDGYMHLSTREQALATANIHFAGAADLVALEIPFAPIAELIKFELAPKRGEAFPHLYGALRTSFVVRAIALTHGDNGFAFGEAL